MGCNKVEDLIRWNVEQQKNGKEGVPSTLLHNNFNELESCATRCDICRVFRQALLLEEVTFDGVKELKDTKGEVVVRWEETTASDGTIGFYLTVQIEDRLERAGVVSCNSKSEIAHLALHSEVRNTTVIEQAKQWLDTCLNNHIGQCDNLRYSSESPRLLIEILSPELIRLREKQPGEYVALSYCWGKPQSDIEQEEVERGKTYTTNLDRRRQPFRIEDLPATVRDALYIVRTMGIRYAWIDALCNLQDTGEGVAQMHKVYSNALFTLCSCATTKATAKLLDQRKAWTQRTEPCRLGGQWLTTSDMSLTELRLRSPLAERAWTLQEERLSPRMLYISSSRFYWSCASGHEMELTPTYEQKGIKLQRPVYATSDRKTQLPRAQEFLLECFRKSDGTSDTHTFWADIVKTYASRDMSDPGDRLKALSGLAAKYLSANNSDQYLAGLWATNLPEGLAWKAKHSVDIRGKEVDSRTLKWPSWSWATLPLKTEIETDAKSARSAFFQMIADQNSRSSDDHDEVEKAIEDGQKIKTICVTGRMRTLWKPSSRRVEWSSVSKLVGGEEKFTFAIHPEQNVHAIHAASGRVLVYEDRKREIVGQLDFQHDVGKVQSGQMELLTLEIGETTMLLLEMCGEGVHRRVGVAWDVRKDFFASVQCEVLILR